MVLGTADGDRDTTSAHTGTMTTISSMALIMAPLFTPTTRTHPPLLAGGCRPCQPGAELEEVAILGQEEAGIPAVAAAVMAAEGIDPP
jgi:hypothetical protein